jgi:hypothetical protein
MVIMEGRIHYVLHGGAIIITAPIYEVDISILK